MYKEKILKIAEKIENELIEIRRNIHSYPEIGLKEKKTAALIEKKMRELDLDVKTNICETGVVATLKGKYPGNTLLIRADMDCLPITELNNLEYKSKHKGFMHACGHDAHVAWTIGAAIILSELRDEIHGNIKFVFQPAEELPVPAGAETMIKEGVLNDPDVTSVIGAHVWPDIDSGKIGIKNGPMMASPDLFKIIVKGEGGHGAKQHTCVDPIFLANQIYMNLQTIVSKKIDPLESVLLSIGMFSGGSSANIIPETVEMQGTVRTFSFDLRDKMPKMIEAIIKGIVEPAGGTYEFEYTSNCPPVINDENMVSLVEKAGKDILGNNNVIKLKKPTMIGEDFSYYQMHVPGVFFFVGTKNVDKGIVNPLHSPNFNIDEDILAKTSAVLAQSAIIFSNKI